jgi:hypothetical protein
MAPKSKILMSAETPAARIEEDELDAAFGNQKPKK